MPRIESRSLLNRRALYLEPILHCDWLARDFQVNLERNQDFAAAPPGQWCRFLEAIGRNMAASALEDELLPFWKALDFCWRCIEEFAKSSWSCVVPRSERRLTEERTNLRKLLRSD